MCARELSQDLQRRLADDAPAADAPEADIDFAVVDRVFDVPADRQLCAAEIESLKRF